MIAAPRSHIDRRPFAGIIVILGVWALVWALTPTSVMSLPHRSFFWWTAMKGLVWIGLGAALLRPRQRRDWWGEYRGRSWLVLLLAIGWVGIDVSMMHLGWKASPPPRADLVSAWNVWLNVLVLAPLLEELLFRGLFWSALEKIGLRTSFVWIASTSAFAVLHIPGWIGAQGLTPALLPQIALVTVAGLFFGLGRWLTGSVWPAVFLHLINNVASLGVFIA